MWKNYHFWENIQKMSKTGQKWVFELLKKIKSLVLSKMVYDERTYMLF